MILLCLLMSPKHWQVYSSNCPQLKMLNYYRCPCRASPDSGERVNRKTSICVVI